jgi:hypothetical protein
MSNMKLRELLVRNVKKILSPSWENERMKDVETHGGSFWVRTR